MNEKELTQKEIDKIIEQLKGQAMTLFAQSIRIDYNPEIGLSYLYSDLVNSPHPLVLYLDRELTQARELRRQLGIFLDAIDKGAEWHRPQSSLQ